MAKIFLSYRFTGENLIELEKILRNIKTTLETGNNGVTCSFFLEDFFKERKFTADDIYEYMLREQTKCDTYLAFLKSIDKSKGMILESKKAQELNQRYVVAYKQGIFLSEFHTYATYLIEFANYSELNSKLKSVFCESN